MTKQDAPDVTKQDAAATPPDAAERNADAQAANTADAETAPDTGGARPTPETAAALAEVERLEAATGLNRTGLTPHDLTAEGERGDLARAVAAYGGTFKPADGSGDTPPAPTGAPAPTPEAAKPPRRGKTKTETPDKTASAKATDAANVAATDPAKVKAEQSGADLPADLRERQEADAARLGELEAAALTNPAGKINRSAAEIARARRNADLARQDAATNRAAMRSAQIYGGLEGGEYGLNPADPTNRARVMVGEAPAAPDTGAANGVAASGTGGAGSPAPTQGARPLPDHIPGLVQSPTGAPVAAPAIPGPTGGPAPTKTPDAAKGS